MVPIIVWEIFADIERFLKKMEELLNINSSSLIFSFLCLCCCLFCIYFYLFPLRSFSIASRHLGLRLALLFGYCHFTVKICQFDFGNILGSKYTNQRAFFVLFGFLFVNFRMSIQFHTIFVYLYEYDFFVLLNYAFSSVLQNMWEKSKLKRYFLFVVMLCVPKVPCLLVKWWKVTKY